MNHRFLLLNDCYLTKQRIKTNQYDINSIPQLYRVFVCGDEFVINMNHAIADGMSSIAIFSDLMRLINNDKFSNTKIPYLSIEQCIKQKYASSAIYNKITNYTPTHLALKFGKFYANNHYLSHYNPLGLHRDEIQRFKFYFSDKLVTFPLGPFDKTDYRINFKHFHLSKAITFGIKMQCKQNKVHMSSLFQYLASAAMIECHGDVLKKDYYKTLFNNIFTTVPMYEDPKKIYLGVHAAGFMSEIEYFRDLKIGGNKFWNVIRKIDNQVVSDDMVTKV